jgi:hypothetical protein
LLYFLFNLGAKWGWLFKATPRPFTLEKDLVPIVKDLEALGWGGMEWIILAQIMDKEWAVVSAVMNILVLQNAGNFLTS